MNTALLVPVLIQVFLTFFLLFRTGILRFLERKNNPQLDKSVAIDPSKWSEHTRKTTNSLSNQFETPILFYIAIAFSFILNIQNPLLLPLAWAYVITRLIHMLIHIGPNIVIARFFAFVLGVLILISMWAVIASEVSL